jgi:hypothetical protein
MTKSGVSCIIQKVSGEVLAKSFERSDNGSIFLLDNLRCEYS